MAEIIFSRAVKSIGIYSNSGDAILRLQPAAMFPVEAPEARIISVYVSAYRRPLSFRVDRIQGRWAAFEQRDISLLECLTQSMEVRFDRIRYRHRILPDSFTKFRCFTPTTLDIHCFPRRPAHEATRRRRHRKETRGTRSPRLSSCGLVGGAYRFEVKPSLTWIQRRESQAVARSQS